MSYIGRGIDQIDNISTLDNLSFNGSDATFNLTQNSVAFVPVSADALQIQIDGVIQSGNYTVSGSTVTFDFTPSGSSVCNGIKHFGVGVLTTPSDGSVNMAQLGASGTKSSSTFLAGDNTFKTVSGTTINNNADNRVITGSGTANTLNGESTLTYDGTQLVLTDATEGTDNLLVKTTADGSISMALEKSDFKFDVGLDHNNDGSQNFYIRERHQGGSNTNAVRMMIDSSGRVFVNTTSAVTGEGYLQVRGSTNLSAWMVNSNGMVALRFFNASNSGVGGITINGSGTVYATSSDYRLKENEVAISDGIERLKQLKPYKFNFKTEPDTTVDGFFAHEVSSIVPEAITGTKDEVEKNENGTNKLDDDGNTIPKHQEIDQSKLVPLLTSALQEAITKIETLEARVQTLESE
jgi:hypothetical protein